jgi:hypothetical protein
MAHVYAELEHGEPIGHQILAKTGRCLPFLLGIRWQIEEDQDPHDAVGIEVAVVHGRLG